MKVSRTQIAVVRLSRSAKVPSRLIGSWRLYCVRRKRFGELPSLKALEGISGLKVGLGHTTGWWCHARGRVARFWDGRKAVYALALGKFSSSPFSSELVVACRSSLESALKAGGIDIVQNDAPQAVRARWLQAVALGVGDHDAHFASMVAGGVRTGALSSLPRTPAIFEKKSKWALHEETGSAGETTTSPQLSAWFEEEVKELLMTKVSVKKTQEEWG